MKNIRQRLTAFGAASLLMLSALFPYAPAGAHGETKSPDFNNDYTVNIFDLSFLLSKWNLTGEQPADLNDDGTVNIFDLSAVLTNWGPVPLPQGIIPNASVETADSNTPAKPANWHTSQWGNLTANFSYLETGHFGSRSIRTEITNYTDGDAKWYFEPVQLTPAKDYSYSDWYQSSADSRVVLAITKQDGTTVYQELPVAPASAAWKQYTASFTMPADGATLTVFHLLNTTGYLVIDDVNIDDYVASPFTRGLVTLTFDDGWEENIHTAIPIMEEFGYQSNQFYATTFIENSPYPNATQTIKTIAAKGHEMGSHTVTHPDLTTLSATQLNHELSYSKNYLEGIFKTPINYFATPYGSYNTPVLGRIMNYYTVHRTVNTGYNSKDNFDITQLKVQNVLSNTTAAEVDAWVKKAQQDKTWLILVLHRVADNPGPYDTTPVLFRAQLNAIKANDAKVVTISEALAEINPQLQQ